MTLAKSAARIVGIATAADGRGYRLVSADGHVYSFGVPGHGEHVVGKSAAPAIGIGAAAGDGYWVAYADGTIAAFDTRSLGNAKLTKSAARVVAITGSLDGRGYWLATADGHVHAFGVPYRGDLVSTHVRARVVGIAAGADGGLLADDGYRQGVRVRGAELPVAGRRQGEGTDRRRLAVLVQASSTHSIVHCTNVRLHCRPAWRHISAVASSTDKGVRYGRGSVSASQASHTATSATVSGTCCAVAPSG